MESLSRQQRRQLLRKAHSVPGSFHEPNGERCYPLACSDKSLHSGRSIRPLIASRSLRYLLRLRKHYVGSITARNEECDQVENLILAQRIQ